MKTTRNNFQSIINDTIKIAPIFHHGHGFGRYGCFMPQYAFIPKDDAKIIIFDTLKDEGIEFNTTDCPTVSFDIIPEQPSYNPSPHSYLKYYKQLISPKLDAFITEIDHYLKVGKEKEAFKKMDNLASTFFYSNYSDRKKINNKIREFLCSWEGKFNEGKTEKVEIKLDGYNEEYNLAILFISISHEELLTTFLPKSSVSSFNIKQCANLIRRQLFHKNKMNIGLFYDPAIMINSDDEDFDKAKYYAAVEANQLLLAQVNDFIEWLNNEELLDNIFLRNILNPLGVSIDFWG